jgi:Xaa-Pro dipeptidase
LALSRTVMKRRASKLAKGLDSVELAGVVISPGPNMTYYTGTRAQLLERPFLLLMQRDGNAHLLAPKLEAGPFRKLGFGLTIHEWDDTEGPNHAFEELFGEIGSKGVWGCEGRLPFGFLDHLLTRGMKVEPVDEILQSIRAVKEPFELELIRDSAKILLGAYLKIPGSLREGMSERELSRRIVEDALAGGAEMMETCMVQSGSRAADPHSETSSKKIKRGESIVIDSVCFYEGYAADITRTFVIGKESSSFEKVYSSVLTAQETALPAIPWSGMAWESASSTGPAMGSALRCTKRLTSSLAAGRS